jgi:small-conductance mechanosensitive channel
MLALIQNHPLVIGTALLFVDLLLWHLLAPERVKQRIVTRVTAFLLFSWAIMSAGISPLQSAPWPDNAALNLVATVIGILWWLFAARTLTVVLSFVLMPRTGHTGRLLQDVLGAVIFLVAIVAAAAYVLQLPVKGLLATSGAVAIIVGLAVQSTLSDVFSGIVLNTTKPYQLDDWISIDGTEGKVVDIDWRATHLMTAQGSMAVIPNSVAAKAKILNFSRPNNVHGVSISISVPASVRPRRVLDALDRALQGTRALLDSPAPKIAVKNSTLESVEYEASGFVLSMEHKLEVRNLLFDLAYRHLEAAGVMWSSEAANRPWTRQRTLLEEVKIFRSLSEEDKDRLAQAMTPVEYATDQVILELDGYLPHLLVISTGVISASISNGDTLQEVGRMGPAEILGEEGILSEGRSEAQFRTLSSCLLFQIDKDILRGYLNQRADLKVALTKLQHFRQRSSQSMLLQKPTPLKKAGFLHWLQNR